MDRDTFIITVYCLLVELYDQLKKQHRIRRGGFLPRLSDAEVLTIEICGEFLKLHQDVDLFGYFRQHYQHLDVCRL